MKKLLVLAGLLLGQIAIAQVQPETKTGSVVVGAPTGGNQGLGSINTQSLYVNGAAVVGGAAAINAHTRGTNISAAKMVGTGGSLGVSGSGTIAATSAPVAGIGGLGSGIATFLATPSSANFAAAVTGETGTGALVFATSPTFVTPALGVVASGDISATTSLSTGSVTGRTPAARGAEVYNVLDWCASVCTSASVMDTAVSAAVTAINAAGGGQLYFPPGLSWAITTQHIFTTYAASLVGGGINTTTILTNGGAGFEWTTATSQSNGGHCTIRDFRMFQNDNATSGSQILLNNVDFCTINNVQLGGGFISLDIASSVAINITNFVIEGHNNTSGSMGMRIHRTNSGASNASEIAMNNCDIRADASGTLTYGMRISDSDGLYVGNCHIGFGASSALLVQAENITDQLDGILFADVNLDTTSTGPGLDLETLAGMTGANGGNGFVGGSISNMAAQGILANDSNVGNTGPGWSFTGVQVVGNGTHGIDLEAGSNYVISGGFLSCNNRTAASADHINMGGSASQILVAATGFSTGAGSRCTNAVTDNILVAGTTAQVQIGQNLYSGGTSNVVVTSGGAGIVQVGTFATANAATPPAIGGTTPAAIAATTLSSNAGATFVGGSMIVNNSGSFGANFGTGSNTGTMTFGNASGGAIALSSATMKMGANLWCSVTVPQVASGGGTSPSVVGTNDCSFRVVEGATGTPSTTLVLNTFPTATTGWGCPAIVDVSSSSITARQSGSSTTGVTIVFSSAPANSDIIELLCGAR